MRPYPPVIFFSLVAGLTAIQPAAAQKFDCGSMPADSRTAISDSLDQAQAHIDNGNFESAAELTAIGSGIIRFGMGSQYVDFECVGKDLRTRLFRLRRQVHQPLGKAAEESARRRNPAYKFHVVHDYLIGRNLDDVKRVLNRPRNPKLVKQAGPQLRKMIERMNYSVENGHGLIPEEQQTLAVYTNQLDMLIKSSKAKAAALLKQEDEAETGPITDTETTIDDTVQMTEAITGSMLGADDVIAGDRESNRVSMRAVRSIELLRQGRRWVDWIDADAPAALKSRAIVRGDAMLARADDLSNAVEVRDRYYGLAIDYFEMGAASQSSAKAKASREVIQPAVQTERASREQRLEQKAEELKRSAEEFKRSMEKTAEEQESFNSEADSLEDELGL